LGWLVPRGHDYAVLTPLTTQANGWRTQGRSPLLHAHTELGDTMVYFSIALVVAAALIAFVHLRQARGKTVKTRCPVAHCGRRGIASVATTAQVYRIGDSGAKATWNKQSAAGSSTP
jgi:hypothetical protein